MCILRTNNIILIFIQNTKSLVAAILVAYNTNSNRIKKKNDDRTNSASSITPASIARRQRSTSKRSRSTALSAMRQVAGRALTLLAVKAEITQKSTQHL